MSRAPVCSYEAVEVDNAMRMGHAERYAVDPNLFPVDGDGYSILQPHEVKPEGEHIARQGVEACPDQAPFLEEDS